MDFITNLPTYNGKSVIMVVIDRFPKAVPLGSTNIEALDTTLTTKKRFSLYYEITQSAVNREWSDKQTSTELIFSLMKEIGFI